MPYETHYGHPLIDAIHNYFPAMIYEQEIFQTVPDIFAYVRMQMQQHFDLFASGRARYHPIRPRILVTPPPVQPPTTMQPQTNAQTHVMSSADLIHASAELLHLLYPLSNTTMPPPMQTTMPPPMQTTYHVPLNMQFSYNTNMAPENFADPVIVRPTEQDVMNATTIGISTTPDEVCAICQDSIEEDAETRSIDYCDHQFHKHCVDTWFQQNVRCPVCRHDIRDFEEGL